MYHDTTFPPGTRLAAFERMIDAFERDEIEAAVDALIARLDAADGDPDIEDSEAGNPHVTAAGRYLLATVIAQDPPDDGLDNVGDVAWQEWDSRNAIARLYADTEPAGDARLSEDNEQDDDDSCVAGEDQIAGNAALGYGHCQLHDDDREAGAWWEGFYHPYAMRCDGNEANDVAAQTPFADLGAYA